MTLKRHPLGPPVINVQRVSAKSLAASLACLLLLAGCEGDSQKALIESPQVPSATLATVDGTVITREQLELAVERTLGNAAPMFANEEVERKILESLVSSRAMALLAEGELSPSERAQLDLRAQAYREELLVRHYLEAHATPEPVPAEKILDYYQRHPAEFGGGVERSFETITSSQLVDDSVRSELIQLLSSASLQASNWPEQVASWRNAGKPLEYQQSRIKPELLDQPLRGLVESTPVGAIAPLVVNDRLLLVRVVEEQRLPARPLAEVSAEIRAKLAPQVLKQAVRSLSAKALQQVEVQYSSH